MENRDERKGYKGRRRTRRGKERFFVTIYSLYCYKNLLKTVDELVERGSDGEEEKRMKEVGNGKIICYEVWLFLIVLYRNRGFIK